MFNMDIEPNTNSIPFLLYMIEQEEEEKRQLEQQRQQLDQGNTNCREHMQ